MLRFDRKQQNSVKQLSLNKKKNHKLRKKKKTERQLKEKEPPGAQKELDDGC